MRDSKILLTGATGFIGSNLLPELFDYSVSVLGRSKPEGHFDEFVQMPLVPGESYTDSLLGVDIVIHLAAVAHNNSSDLDYIEEINVEATRNLAVQAADSGVKRFIFLSSIGVLGDRTEIPFTESSESKPQNACAVSKLKAEKVLLEISERSGMELVIIRPVLVYGNKAPGNFGLLKKLIRSVPLLPFSSIHNKRSFISIGNLVDFIKLCISHPKARNEIFCIADGNDISILEFTNAVAIGLSKKVVQIPVPAFLFKFVGFILMRRNLVEQIVGDLQVDISKAKGLLGWTPPETMKKAMSKLK